MRGGRKGGGGRGRRVERKEREEREEREGKEREEGDICLPMLTVPMQQWLQLPVLGGSPGLRVGWGGGGPYDPQWEAGWPVPQKEQPATLR